MADYKFGGIATKPTNPLPSSATSSPTRQTQAQTSSPSGLLSNSLAQPVNQPFEYNPTTSVNDNINQLTNSDSIYMQQARQSGLNTAASRGLLNSSIAAGASQQAAINAATPIAQQDAQTEYNKWNMGKDVQANLQGEYTKAIKQVMSDHTVNISQIETAEGVTQAQKDQMIKNTIARRDADMAFLKNLYSAMPVWSNNWSSFPTMPGAPGVAMPEGGA